MRLENDNTSIKAPTQHPHGEDISAYVDGMLDIRKMRIMAEHIGSCPKCGALHQSLRQIKFRLGELSAPPSPGSEFWQNAYRDLRVQGSRKQPWTEKWRESIAWRRNQTRRRIAVGFAVLALVSGAVATPLMLNSPSPEPSAAASSDVVDLSSLVRAHTQYAASQPLSDPDRQTMISADADDAVGLRAIPAQAMGDGGSFAADSAH